MQARLKHRLRPLAPVLRPIWHRVRPLVARDSAISVPTTIERWWTRAVDTVYRAAGRRPPPIRPLRHVELVDLAAAEPYYRPRLGYLAVAGSVVAEMVARKRLRTALELGPHLRSLIVGADVMDVIRRDGLQAEGRRIVADATKAPWPVEDKAYDLFVALQVFEHLGTRQPEAFREVRRIARNAILSLPIDWVMADPRNCHHGLTDEQVLAWFAPIAPTRVVVGNAGHRKRLLYVFEDLPAPDGTPGLPDASAPVEAAATAG
jgi:hypothetical protein